MKSPDELAGKLARQWEYADLREARLLEEPDVWPVTLIIGKPSAIAIRDNISEVREHFDTWRNVSVGEVVWKESRYRSTTEPVCYPDQWVIPDIEAWIVACRDRTVSDQYNRLAHFISLGRPEFQSLLIRRRSLWLDRESREVEQCLRLAPELHPGCADGLPLRALPIVGNDTKFFERNERLLLVLLDILHDGEATHQGLETFLGAYSERGHWLLVIDLDGTLMPFSQCRLRASELRSKSLPGSRLLIVENETCQHQLPKLPDTVAVLGSGFDLSWTDADWLRQKRVGYWGDLDTWGLDLLARARKNVPEITPLLMTQEVFDAHRSQVVPEKFPAGPIPPPALTDAEKQLYLHIRGLSCGRLEQEFLPAKLVNASLKRWLE